MKTTFLLLATLILASTAHAQVVIQFSADDGAPAAQDFTQSGSGSVTPAATTYLGEHVWRVKDADEDQIGYQFTHDITAGQISTLQSRGYRVSARVAFLETTYNDSVSSLFYFGDGTRRYLVWLDINSNDELVVTPHGGTSVNLGSADNHAFYNLDIDVAPGGSTAELLVNGEVRQTGWISSA